MIEVINLKINAMNIILYRFLLVFGIITLLIPVFFTIFKYCLKNKVIEIKKAISIKHDLEQYLNLDTFFLNVINSETLFQRIKNAPISDKDTIKENFKKECIEMTQRVLSNFQFKNF